MEKEPLIITHTHPHPTARLVPFRQDIIYTECRKKFPDGRRDFDLRQGGGRRRYLKDNAKADNAASNQKHPVPND
ncbi:hypothetical protein Cflav_PD3198 [Pedosphaera parvula Ellin514]|uniref:Uncharacterized protein n=1 Tax=Pedosphaera parvula (strain Ellin514) TaxID=320771 RepID=B9XJA1_PEDPL|nr:hypothetical protein Cflav_PD3198 [Pedosphaera parvula Ellin514]